VTAIDLRECESCGDVVRQYPLFAGVITALIGALAYAGISVLMRGSVDSLEVGLFALLFGAGYTGARFVTEW
jgi:hypothetical protein